MLNYWIFCLLKICWKWKLTDRLEMCYNCFFLMNIYKNLYFVEFLVWRKKWTFSSVQIRRFSHFTWTFHSIWFPNSQFLRYFFIVRSNNEKSSCYYISHWITSIRVADFVTIDSYLRIWRSMKMLLMLMKHQRKWTSFQDKCHIIDYHGSLYSY